MAAERVDLDTLVDYRQAYEAALEGVKLNGLNLLAICPFHADKNASLSVELRTGKYHCFACGASGNYVDFYARMHDIPTSEAFKEILQAHGVEPERPRGRKVAGVISQQDDAHVGQPVGIPSGVA